MCNCDYVKETGRQECAPGAQLFEDAPKAAAAIAQIDAEMTYLGAEVGRVESLVDNMVESLGPVLSPPDKKSSPPDDEPGGISPLAQDIHAYTDRIKLVADTLYDTITRLEI